MRSPIKTFIVVTAAAIALVASPAAAQHRGGGHSGGGHAGGGHSGGGHASSGSTHGATHAGGGSRTSTRRPVVGRAVPRTSVASPRVDQHTTVVLPSHRSHLGVGAFGLGLGVGAYTYPYGYGYSRYGSRYPGYYGYSSGYSGGYVRSGHARLRIVDAPRGAEVYVDGYYAGIVDDFDGVFQHLELQPGAHQIEIRAPGFAPIVFDMQAIDGRTITYRAQMAPYRP